MIQGIINRLAHDSFLIKGWSMTILAAGMVFIARSGAQYGEAIVLGFFILAIGFWILDGYFLQQERLFIKVYNEIRKQETTDFEMNHKKHKNEHGCGWLSSIFSETLAIFYGIEIVFVVLVFCMLKNLGDN